MPSNVKANTLKVKTNYLNRLKADRGNTPAERFVEKALLDWLPGAGWGQSSCHLAAAIVKPMFRWAVGNELLAENPFADAKVMPPILGVAAVQPERR